jgi:uncharacterized repeat protein (TIGR01451 family)
MIILDGKTKLLQRCAIGAVSAMLVSLPAIAQTTVRDRISNTANGTYRDLEGVLKPMTSNTVVTPVFAIDATPPTLEFYVSGTGPGSLSLAVGGGCGPVAESVVSMVPAVAAAPGVPLYVVVTDKSANYDAEVRETIETDVAQNGRTVRLVAKETGVDTGTFVALLETSLPGAGGQCVLPIDGNAALSGTYGNRVASASDQIAASPYNVVFDSSTLKVVKGGQVSIVDAATGAPAKVYGLDGKTSYPATVTIGKASADAGGHVYEVPTGGFSFPVLGAGSYRLVVTGTPGTSFPSVTSPQDFASSPIVGGRAIDVVDGSYGEAFTVPALSAFSIDVPVDPEGGSLVVTKQVSNDVATPGDYLQYRVTVENKGLVVASRPSMKDVMPQGLRYQSGSLRVNGAKVADLSTDGTGSTMTGILPALKANSTYTVTYVALVTSNASIGDAVNAVSVKAGGLTSNTAKVGVRIDGGLFSDAVTIIGRVVSDSCLSTSGKARAVPNVRVLLEDGTYVMTDENGQYHIENVRPGLHVAQIDRNSIPKGFHVSKCGDNVARGGNGLSQFIDARGGALWRADFFLDRDADAVAPLAIGTITSEPAAITTPSLMGAATPGAGTATPDGTVPATVTPAITSGGPSVVVPGPITTRPPGGDVAFDQKTADMESAKAAGSGVDWIARATGKAEILFPAVDHNPRAPAQRIVVSRLPADKVVVKINGIKVDPLLQDQSDVNADKTAAVDVWSGVPLTDGVNHIVAFVTHADGKTETLTRDVSFVNSADHAEFVPSLSKLVADGSTSPVIAIRVLDRDGHPVRSGIGGSLGVSAPYQTIDAVQRRRDSQLVSQTLSSASSWKVDGDDGIAYVALAPTTQTGEIKLDLHLRDAVQGMSRLQDSGSVLDRRDEIRAWLSPGKQDWVVVGFAAGSAGYTTLARQAESLGSNPGKTDEIDGQVKFYAKGRVKGKWLLTLAYDSDKKSDRQRRQSVLTTIDPEAYYTLYGDNAQQGYDAQSTRNLFVKLETKQFYALFGDFSTSMSDTELGQYQRTLNGAKAEYRSQKTSLSAFVASTPFRHMRNEIQGQGLSGPYQLGRRDLVLNTERVVIETRDRFRPELIVSSRDLVRFIDYDVDYARGTITLRSPLASRDADLNNVFMVVDYETLGDSQNRIVAGGRASRQFGKTLVVGATGIQNDDDRSTRMGVLDATVRIGAATQVRGEAGYSNGGGTDGHAYVAEVQHRGTNVEARGYVREQTRSYGVGQTNAVDAGYRKEGVDVAYRVAKGVDVAATAYELDDLSSDARRRAAKIEGRAQLKNGFDVTANLQNIRERGVATQETSVTQVGATAQKSFMDNRLLVTGEVAKSISGDDTVSTPSRYRVGASYAITSALRVLVDHEIATGAGVTDQNTRVGFEATPWKGGTLTSSYNKQAITENGDRTFGAFGARQTFAIDKRWSADVSVDSQRTIGGADRADIVNPLNTPTLGGRISDGTLDGDYTSVSAGLARQSDRTSWTGRVEARFGTNQRYGLATGLVHQLSDGRVWGGSANAYRLNQYDGGRIDHADSAFSIALRAPTSRIQILDKLEGIYDKVGLGTGSPGYYQLPVSQTAIAALADGSDYGPVAATAQDATALRLVNNFALNWLIGGSEENASRTQLSFYYGSKWSMQSFDGQTFGGYTDMTSVEARHDVTRWLDVGIQAGSRRSWGAGTTHFSIGPTIGLSPIKNSWVSIGYNFTGFRDRDFSGANATIKGAWLTLRMKFNEENLGLAKPR